MDPVLGSVIAGALASGSAVAIAIVTGRNNAERLMLLELVKRLKRYIVTKCGLSEEEVDDL